ncbi:uncharacterized protein LOC112538591 [Tetranychus urticae]|nr:uncharacterized protein LOC112538591 [Tetranychus urticae]
MNMRLLSLEGATGNTMAMGNSEYPVEWKLRSAKDYTSYAEKRIANIKLDNEWRKNFLSIEFPGVDKESKEKIVSAIFKQRLCVSSIINTIAKETIGIQKLSYQALGCHGIAVATGGSTKNSRPTIAQEDENKLRAVVGFLDKIFVSKNGWEYLVRRPVNQMGREFKSGKRDQADISTYFNKSPKQVKLAASNSASPLQLTSTSEANTTTHHAKAISGSSVDNSKDDESRKSSSTSKEMSTAVAKAPVFSSIGNIINTSNTSTGTDFLSMFNREKTGSSYFSRTYQ